MVSSKEAICSTSDNCKYRQTCRFSVGFSDSDVFKVLVFIWDNAQSVPNILQNNEIEK